MEKVLKTRKIRLVYQTELSLPYPKRKCARCGNAEIYLDLISMDYCEPCLWESLSSDSDFKLGAGTMLIDSENKRNA